MHKKSYIPVEANWVIRIRNVAGAVALIGVGVLGGFSIINLRPGWEWMQQKNPSDSSTREWK